MTYRILINGKVWATGLTPEAAERVAAENRARLPHLDIKVEAVTA